MTSRLERAAKTLKQAGIIVILRGSSALPQVREIAATMLNAVLEC